MAAAVLFFPITLHAQASADAAKQAPEPRPASEPRPSYHPDFVVRSYRLLSIVQQNDANEILIALRNIFNPEVHIFLVASENTIVVAAGPEQQRLAQDLIKELDRPKPIYRITYTLTEIDDGKRVGTQHYSMIVVAGQRTTLKQGSKIPVQTGPNPGSSKDAAQYQYLDIGMNFDATADPYANGIRLRSKVEQSGLADEKSSVGIQDPIVRQTVLEGTSFLLPGKPMVLGSVDVPGSTRRVDVEAMMEPIS